MPDYRQQDGPDYETENVKNQQPELGLLRALQAGFPACTALLIKRNNESRENFINRSQIPLMFDAVTPFIRDIVGRLLEKDPQFDPDVSQQFEQLADNIDNRGTGFTPFCNNVFTDAVWAGHSFILVDHTTVENAVNLADEIFQGARPYWVFIKKDAIKNFRPIVVDGVIKLGLISIQEAVEEADGEFGYRCVTQWRVLRRRPDGATWQLYRKNANGRAEPLADEAYFLGAGGVKLPDIPLVPFYSRQTGFFESRPLAIELARLVQSDYNVVTDMEHSHFNSCYDQLITKGVDKEAFENAARSGLNGIHLPEVDQSAAYIAGAGTGVDLGMRMSEKFRREMVVQGNRLFETDQPDRETATAKSLDDSIDRNLTLQMANSFQDSLAMANEITQMYLDGKSGGSIILSPNQEPPAVTPGSPTDPALTPKPVVSVPSETRMLGQ